MMRKRSLSLLVVLLIVSCTSRQTGFDRIYSAFTDSADSAVLVVAHRGDWHHAPENSMEAIVRCVDLGVDMVEVDVRKTGDGHFILMHDETVDRTTDGTGRVDEMTLDEIKDLKLRDHHGQVTEHRVPTLDEVLLAVKGRIMLNLDMAYEIMDEIVPLGVKTGTLNHLLFKGHSPVDATRSDISALPAKVNYMPILYFREGDAKSYLPGNEMVFLEGYLKEIGPEAVEIVFDDADHLCASLHFLNTARTSGARTWVNTLNDGLCGGHCDCLALDNPGAHWGWCVGRGFNMVQTDEPQALLTYLRSINRHW